MLKADFLSEIANTFFPRRCPLCGKTLEKGEVICKECARKIGAVPYVREESKKWFFDAMFFRAPYDGVMGEIVKVYKFSARWSLSTFLADKFMEVLDVFSPPKNSVLTYVPPTFKSLKEKGFDHMKTIAKKVSIKSGVSFRTLLEVKKQRKYQVGLSKEKRKEIVFGKYGVLDDELYKTSGNVVLIDDVFTTGATLNECARVLKISGASSVWVYVLAKV